MKVVCFLFLLGLVWGAHGQVWPLQHERRWQVTTPQNPLSLLLYGCLLYIPELHHHTLNIKVTHVFVRFFPKLCPSDVCCCRQGKFLTASLWNDSPPHLVGLLVVNHFCPPRISPPPWTALTSTLSSVWNSLSGRAALTSQSYRSASPRLHLTEPGHHENLEAAEELCLCDLRTPRLVPVRGDGTRWQHGVHAERWVENTSHCLNFSHQSPGSCNVNAAEVEPQCRSEHESLDWMSFMLLLYVCWDVSSLCFSHRAR